MTEQQFEKIKMLLDASESVEGSHDLDNSILNAAKQQAEINKHKENAEQEKPNLLRSLLTWLKEFNPAGIAQAAVLSLVLTLAVFVGMAQLLKTDEEWEVAINDDTNIEFQAVDGVLENEAHTQGSKRVVAKPNLEFKMPNTQKARDQILANMTLPNVDDVLGDMTLPANENRQAVESVVSAAMDDIRFMLNRGQLDDARIRYAKLKEYCSECSLPDSLEALLFSSLSSSST